MAVLVFCGSNENGISKSILEAICFGAQIAEKQQTNLHVLASEHTEASILKQYGADYIVKTTIKDLNDPVMIANLITETIATIEENISSIILTKHYNTPTIGGLLCGKLKAPYLNNIKHLESATPLQVKRSIFSGKGFETIEINTQQSILSLSQNSIEIKEKIGKGETISIDINPKPSNAKIIKQTQNTSKISLSNASIIVTGGRGLKGPENWHILESLASELNAALACTRAVSDEGWRPHEEHVGQTGKQVAPNLYIAVGVSGAIQHLAGVNGSKVKIVINIDPKAPFFKASDYGIVGDAFELIPKLTDLIKSKIACA